MKTTSIEEDILRLKKERDAVILAHYYETGDIQDVADEIGDSLYLAQVGRKRPESVVLLAGVVFMGESVKLLSPEKRVLVPDLKAGCSLVTSSPAREFKKWREQYPDAVCVTYVNSSTEVKALSDVICTSSNAVKIIESIPHERQILFAPDKNLGRWLARKTGRKNMIMWEGSCEVHVLFSARRLFELRSEHPDAVVIAHPECDETVLAYSDVIGSTSRLLEEVKNNKAKKFIVATEDGIFHQMKKLRPDAELIQAPVEDATCACNQCPYMKLNTLEKVRLALQTMSPEVSVPSELITRARLPLERMMAITAGQAVDFSRPTI